MKHSEDEPVALICAPVDDPLALVVPGSRINECSVCGCDVWTAPSGQALLAENPHAMIYCTEHGLAVLAEYEASGEAVKTYVRKESLWEIWETINPPGRMH